LSRRGNASPNSERSSDLRRGRKSSIPWPSQERAPVPRLPVYDAWDYVHISERKMAAKLLSCLLSGEPDFVPKSCPHTPNRGRIRWYVVKVRRQNTRSGCYAYDCAIHASRDRDEGFDLMEVHVVISPALSLSLIPWEPPNVYSQPKEAPWPKPVESMVPFKTVEMHPSPAHRTYAAE